MTMLSFEDLSFAVNVGNFVTWNRYAAFIAAAGLGLAAWATTAEGTMPLDKQASRRDRYLRKSRAASREWTCSVSWLATFSICGTTEPKALSRASCVAGFKLSLAVRFRIRASFLMTSTCSQRI